MEAGGWDRLVMPGIMPGFYDVIESRYLRFRDGSNG
jgi:hypothetical protein